MWFWTTRAEPTPVNPGDARQRDRREFGAEMGRRKAERGNRGSRAMSGERLLTTRECRKALRILGITRPVSLPSQNKIPGSRDFATPGFKLSGPNPNLRLAGYETRDPLARAHKRRATAIRRFLWLRNCFRSDRPPAVRGSSSCWKLDNPQRVSAFRN